MPVSRVNGSSHWRACASWLWPPQPAKVMVVIRLPPQSPSALLAKPRHALAMISSRAPVAADSTTASENAMYARPTSNGLRRTSRSPRTAPTNSASTSHSSTSAGSIVTGVQRPSDPCRSRVRARRSTRSAPLEPTSVIDARPARSGVAAHLEAAGRPVGVLEQDRGVVGVVGRDRTVGAGLRRLVEIGSGSDGAGGPPQPPEQHLVQRPDSLDVVAAEPALVTPPLAGVADVRLVPGSVERPQRPDRAIGQEAGDRRVDPVGVRGGDEERREAMPAGRGGRVHHAPRLGRVHRHARLAEDVLARGKRRFGDLRVEVWPRPDHDRIEAGVIDQRAPVRRRALEAELGRGRATRCLRSVRHGDQPHVGNRPKPGHVPVARDGPGAREADAQHAPLLPRPRRQCSDGQTPRTRRPDDHQRRRRVHHVRRLAARTRRPGGNGRGGTRVRGARPAPGARRGTDCRDDRQRSVLHRQWGRGRHRDFDRGVRGWDRSGGHRRVPAARGTRSRGPAQPAQRVRLLGADDGRADGRDRRRRSAHARRAHRRDRAEDGRVLYSPAGTSRRARCRSPRSWRSPMQPACRWSSTRPRRFRRSRTCAGSRWTKAPISRCSPAARPCAGRSRRASSWAAPT